MKPKLLFQTTFYIVFTLIYSILVILCICNGSSFPSSIRSILGILILITLIFLFYRLLIKHTLFIDTYYRHILLIFLLCFGILQLTFGFLLRFHPSFDFSSIYDGAIQWVNTGSFTDFYDYYYYFPNNLGAMTLLYLCFKAASCLGITDYFAIGIIVNCILNLITIAAASWICKQLFNKTTGILVLLFFAISLPFYFLGAAFYTDSLSMAFPVIFYGLYLKYETMKDRQNTTNRTYIKKSVLLLSMGILLSIGVLIKFTVLIILIAVLIDSLFKKHWKQTLAIGVSSFLILMLTLSLFNHYMYQNHLDKDTAVAQNTPILHWVMMGLKSPGGYNPEDYVFTRSLSPDMRNEQLLQEIKNRFQSLGPDGTIHLLSRKAVTCFGDGTYALSDFLDDDPTHSLFIHKFILYASPYYMIYKEITTTVLLTFYALMCLGSIATLGNKTICSYLAPRVAVFGIFLFLLFWEASGRYFTNFIPMILISATFAMQSIPLHHHEKRSFLT